MACPKWSLFVAGLCTFYYICTVLLMFTGFVGLHVLYEDTPATDGAEGSVDPDVTSSEEDVGVSFTRDQLATLVVEFVGNIIMLIVCVFLVVGIKKNNHKFMVPWIYLSIIEVVCDLVMTYFDESESESELASIAAFAFMIFIAAIWFPIFSVYKKLRHANTQPKSNPAAIESTYETPAYFQHVQQTATAPVHV